MEFYKKKKSFATVVVKKLYLLIEIRIERTG